MDAEDMFWFFVFFFLCGAINLSCGLCMSYLDSKPLGHQSIFDCVLRDHFKIGKNYGATFALVIAGQNSTLFILGGFKYLFHCHAK